jgi:small subunit ribosomal protein S15
LFISRHDDGRRFRPVAPTLMKSLNRPAARPDGRLELDGPVERFVQSFSIMITKEKKSENVKKFGKSGNDTGSTAVQIALLTERIKDLSGHLKANKKDNSSTRGLLKMVGQRRRLLSYLKKRDLTGYTTILKQLDLRK